MTKRERVQAALEVIGATVGAYAGASAWARAAWLTSASRAASRRRPRRRRGSTRPVVWRRITASSICAKRRLPLHARPVLPPSRQASEGMER